MLHRLHCLLRVQQHNGEHDDNEGEEFDETQTDQSVGKEIILHGRVSGDTNDQGGEELTNTLSAATDGNHGETATQDGDTTVTHTERGGQRTLVEGLLLQLVLKQRCADGWHVVDDPIAKVPQSRSESGKAPLLHVPSGSDQHCLWFGY